MIVALLVVSIFVSHYGVLSTPIEGVRPTQSAMISDNLDRDLDEIGLAAVWYPRIDYAGNQPGYLLLEMPIQNLAAVLMKRAFGLPSATAYRLTSLILFAVMLAFTFGLVRTRFGHAEAVITTFVLSCFPIATYVSLNPMPDQGALTLLMVGLWSFNRHLEDGRLLHLLLAVLSFGTMLVMKSTLAPLLLVAIGLYQLQKGSLTGLLRRKYIVCVLLCLLPAVLWMAHSGAVNRVSILDSGALASELLADYLGQHGRMSRLTSPLTYVNAIEMSRLAYSDELITLAILGIALAVVRGRPYRLVLLYWLAALPVFFVLFPFHTSTHWYYTYGFAPLLALGIAVGVGPLLRLVLGEMSPGARRVAAIVMMVAGLTVVVSARLEVQLVGSPEQQLFGQALRRTVPSRALGIITYDHFGRWDGRPFYASDTRGWRASLLPMDEALAYRRIRDTAGLGSPEMSQFLRVPGRRAAASASPSWQPPIVDEAFIEERRAQGATFLAHYGSRIELERLRPELMKSLLERYELLVRSPRWIVFSLLD